MSAHVAIVGFGYVGSCVGAVLAAKRYQVTGIDTSKLVVDSINGGEPAINEPGLGDLVARSVASGHLAATLSFDAVKEAKVVIITVGTPMDATGEPDTTQVEAAFRQVSQHLQPGQLIILKSTVPPGTTEDIALPILEESGLKGGLDFHLAFCPERLAEGRALRELQVLPVVVGGIDDASTALAAEFWETALGLETVRVANARTAELSKLADNWWIDLSIAMGNELAQLSAKLGVDVLEVIEAANSLPKGRHHVNILMPSMGVGGSCLTKDPWFVHHMAEEQGLSLKLPAAGRSINDSMPGYTYELIESGLSDVGKNISSSKVAVLGLSFKDNTGDVRLTPTREVLELLEGSGADVAVYDPWVAGDEIGSVTSLTPAASIDEALNKADCVAFLTGHDDFRRLSVEEISGLVAQECVIVDGRMYFARSQIEEFTSRGLVYKGIGR